MTDAESDDRQVIFIMKEDPGAGHLQMAKPDYPEQISVRGPIRSFTQADISQGQPVPRLSRFPLLSDIIKCGLMAWQLVAGTHAFCFQYKLRYSFIFFLVSLFLCLKKGENYFSRQKMYFLRNLRL